VVVLRHGNQYETVYGHLSRFQKGLRAGMPVTQGQVIAFVGMTGLATGPHLHYEFRVNGMPVNPEKVTLPRAMPMDPKTLAQFRSGAAPLVAALDSIDVKRNVAQANTAQPAAPQADTATQ
jgi:murein DD-endopeptidase MepM/ murein hydrolase activator NlpD